MEPLLIYLRGGHGTSESPLSLGQAQVLRRILQRRLRGAKPTLPISRGGDEEGAHDQRNDDGW
jgi:hypothetical protein